MNTPWHLLVHTCSWVPFSSSYSNNMELPDTGAGSSVCMCRINEAGGSADMVNQRLTGETRATGYFPPGVELAKGAILTITGGAYGSVGKKFIVRSPLNIMAGDGSLYVCDLEARE